MYESLEPPSKFKICYLEFQIRIWNSEYLFGIQNRVFGIPNSVFGIPNNIFQILNLDGGSRLSQLCVCHSGNSNPVPFLIPLVVVPIGTTTSATSNWNYH